MSTEMIENTDGAMQQRASTRGQRVGGATQPNTEIARAMSMALADSYGAFLVTQNYHWNVEGPLFKPLHELFEEQYREMFTAIDDVAERLRTLGFYAPGTFEEFEQLSSIPRPDGTRDGEQMVKNLIEIHRVVAGSFRQVAELAGDTRDVATEDLAIQRVATHEKNIWMLRSIVGGRQRMETQPN